MTTKNTVRPRARRVTRRCRTDFAYGGGMRPRGQSAWTGSAWSAIWTVHYVYDGNAAVQEPDGNNIPRVSYTRGRGLSGTMQGAGGIGGLLARTDLSTLITQPSTAHAYYHADGNGNITCLINSSNAVMARYLYDPFGRILSQSGSLAAANLYRFSSKEFHVNSGLVYYLYRFYDPNLQRWVNRDPMGEPGLETLHLLTQPLLIRKLRLWINEPDMQQLLAKAIQRGSINVSDYLRNPRVPYSRGTISASALLNILGTGQASSAPNWPSELLQGPNFFNFVGSDPIDGLDTWGNTWWKPGTWEWPRKVFEPIWIAIEHALGAEAGTWKGAVECVPGIIQAGTNQIPKIKFDPFDPNSPVPSHAG